MTKISSFRDMFILSHKAVSQLRLRLGCWQRRWVFVYGVETVGGYWWIGKVLWRNNHGLIEAKASTLSARTAVCRGGSQLSSWCFGPSSKSAVPNLFLRLYQYISVVSGCLYPKVLLAARPGCETAGTVEYHVTFWYYISFQFKQLVCLGSIF